MELENCIGDGSSANSSDSGPKLSYSSLWDSDSGEKYQLGHCGAAKMRITYLLSEFLVSSLFLGEFSFQAFKLCLCFGFHLSIFAS